ncbi:MAG: S41 family peptidase [Candidatus Omnitrophota bacterium]
MKLNDRRTKVFIFAALLVLVSPLALSGGSDNTKDKNVKVKTKENLYGQLELFADAVSLVKSDYVDEVESKKLMYGAMNGMLSSLDDYSAFMEPDEFKEIKEEAKGEFGGIGIEISYKDGIPAVITPIVGTPAERAGIQPGDRIVKIDGKSTRDIALNDAVKILRGPPGTSVTITVWREKDQLVLDIPIRRAMIKIRSIRKAEFIEDKIGYIKLVEFQENTPRDLEEALKKLESRGMTALILDLRYNPGGLLDVAVDVAEKFIPKDKIIVSLKSRNAEQNAVFKSSGKLCHPDYPLVVMVNEGSASASEIVAGAIQDNSRGIVLGRKTFGKASVQSVIPMKDGSALRLTSALYYTPSGKLIRSLGISPDVVVERENLTAKKKAGPEEIFEKAEKNRKGAVKREEDLSDEKDERDNQLEMAVNLIKAMSIYKSKELR